MAIAINPKQTVPYVLKAERKEPPEKQTVWHFNALSLDQVAQVRDSILSQNYDTQETLYRGGRAELMTLRWGLKSVDNFVDDKGAKIEVETENGMVTDAFLERIAPRDRMELAQAIAARGHVTPTEGN